MRVLFRQTVDLYGVRYSVGLRDVPEGHCCGADWDAFVKAGWAIVQDKPKAVEAVAEVVAETVEAEPVVDDVLVDDAEIVDESVDVVEAEKPKRTRKKKE